MSTQQPLRDSPLSDGDISALLRQAYDCEPPSEEFVARLSGHLEGEFNREAARLAHGRPVSGQHDRMSQRRGSLWRRHLRSVIGTCVAVCVVFGVVIGTSRPSYSWMSMLQALESQPWVESTISGTSEQKTRAWFSQPHRLVVIRKGDDVVWSDWNHQLQSRYTSGASVILRDRLGQAEPRSAASSVLSFLRSNLEGAEPGATAEIGVLSESWRAIGEGDERLVELDVVLSDSEGPPLHLLVTLDPQTHLPLKCQLIDDNAVVASTVRFEYPEEGPEQIYDVGVPRDVVTLDVTSSNEAVQTALAEPERRPIDDIELPVVDQSPPVETVLPEPEELKATDEAETVVSEADVETIIDLELQAPRPVVKSSAEMSQRVDELMAACWETNGVTSVAASSDEEFFRRVYLDLTGRVPSVSECREFMGDTSVDRRQHLVEQLLARRDHATHLGAVWRKMLLPDGVDLSMYGGTSSFEEWLSESFRDNMPYDELVRRLLLAEGRVSESGPILFYTALNLKPEEIAAKTSRAFLGIRLECAQCHDHFFDNRLKQTDFWGLAAFFAQISQPEGKMERVSPVLKVADTDHGEVTLPDSDDVISPKFLLENSLDDRDEAPSRRQQLAAWITATENPHFARATVNRVWAHLFGRGLVDPVDDMRADNPSLCPEVLDELAGYFVATGFDLRDLFRVIVNSQTYQLTSRALDDDPARTMHFAQMNIKSFTAEQLYDSISVATRLEPLETEDGSLMRFSNIGRQAFLEQFRAPPGQVTDYQAGIPQALTLMNGGLMQSATDLRSSGILKSLEAPFFSNEQRVETLFLATLSRLPDDAERQEMLGYVLADADERQQRLSDVLWVLLNSAEFTLNH